MSILKAIWRIDEALDVVKGQIVAVERHMSVSLVESVGKIVAEDFYASCPVPHFRRSTMDGYAVVARYTHGASETMPAMLSLCDLSPASWARVLTGDPIPSAYDAVVMLEYVEELNDGTLLVSRPVAGGENIMEEGEDISAGSLMWRRGVYISPRQVGVLAAQGVTAVKVRDFRVAIISTGNEVVPASTWPEVGQMRDINSHLLTSLCREAGFMVQNCGVVPDDPSALTAALQGSLKSYDAVVLSGGSSAGAADYTERVLNQVGSPGVLVHGLAVKPGKPTVLGVVDGKAVVGLPGHPLSCAIMAEMVALPLLRHAAGAILPQPRFQVAELSRSLVSAPGRRDFVPIRLEGRQAIPLLAKSAAIQVLAQSDGLLVVPEDCEGYNAGREVVVQMWRSV